MRLRTREVEIFIDVLSPHLGGAPAALYLFGSRTRDTAKGGDIDLLLLSGPGAISILKDRKPFILADFKKGVGDRRIDLTLTQPKQAQKDPFLRIIFKTAILLKKWRGRRSPMTR